MCSNMCRQCFYNSMCSLYVSVVTNVYGGECEELTVVLLYGQ